MLTSCFPTQQASESTSTSTQPPPTATETPSPTPEPTATITPTATPQVPDIILQMQADGVPGVEIMEGYKINIRLSSEGEEDVEYLFSEDISFSEANESIRLNDGIYVVKEKDGSKNIALFNPEDETEKFGGKWIRKVDVVWGMKWIPVTNFWALSDERQTEFSRMFIEGFIELNTWEEFFNATEYEKFFMENFPAGTYWPDTDQIITNYNENTNVTPEGEFNWSTPWGVLDDFSKSPFDNNANHFLLLPNPDEGRNYYTGIVTVKVFNPADRNEEQNFGVLHFFVLAGGHR